MLQDYEFDWQTCAMAVCNLSRCTAKAVVQEPKSVAKERTADSSPLQRSSGSWNPPTLSLRQAITVIWETTEWIVQRESNFFFMPVHTGCLWGLGGYFINGKLTFYLLRLVLLTNCVVGTCTLDGSLAATGTGC